MMGACIFRSGSDGDDELQLDWLSCSYCVCFCAQVVAVVVVLGGGRGPRGFEISLTVLPKPDLMLRSNFMAWSLCFWGDSGYWRLTIPASCPQVTEQHQTCKDTPRFRSPGEKVRHGKTHRIFVFLPRVYRMLKYSFPIPPPFFPRNRIFQKGRVPFSGERKMALAKNKALV